MKSNMVYFMIYSAAATSLMYALVKYLNNFNVFQIVFFKSLGVLILTIPLMIKNKILILGNNRKLLLLRGFMGLISMILFFQSIKFLELGISVSIRYTSPIFATFFAFLFLNEKVKNLNWIFLFVSLSGAFIIKGFGLNVDILGFIYALFSAIFLGFVFVITNKIGNTENPLVIITYFMLITFVFGGIMSLSNWVTPSFLELSILLGSGFLGFVGLIYLTKSLQNFRVKSVVPLKYLEVIFSIIIGVIWFGEVYTLWSLVGVALILIGLSYQIIYKK